MFGRTMTIDEILSNAMQEYNAYVQRARSAPSIQAKEELYTQARTAYSKIADWIGPAEKNKIAETYFELGDYYFSQKQYDEAIEEYRAGMQRASLNNNLLDKLKQIANQFVSLGNNLFPSWRIHQYTTEHDKAAKYYQYSIQLLLFVGAADEALELIYKIAKKYKNHGSTRIDQVQFSTKALEFLLEIPAPNIDQKRKIAKSYSSLGTIHFNCSPPNYQQAITCYIQGIQQLLSISAEKKDNDYRALMDLYINLSDSYAHLGNHAAATEAFSNVIIAFNYVQQKTPDEVNIGHPNNSDYTSRLRAYAEQRTAAYSYRTHAECANNWQAVSQELAVHQLTDEVNRFGIAITQPTTATTAAMLPTGASLYAPTFQAPSEENFRAYANTLISISQQQLNAHEFIQAKETLTQALELLERIHEKIRTEQDKQMITFIQTQKQHIDSLAQDHEQRTKGLTQKQAGEKYLQRLATNTDSTPPSRLLENASYYIRGAQYLYAQIKTPSAEDVQIAQVIEQTIQFIETKQTELKAQQALQMLTLKAQPSNTGLFTPYSSSSDDSADYDNNDYDNDSMRLD